MPDPDIEAQIRAIRAELNNLHDVLLGRPNYGWSGLVGRVEALTTRVDTLERDLAGYARRVGDVEEDAGNRRRQWRWTLGITAPIIGSFVLWLIQWALTGGAGP